MAEIKLKNIPIAFPALAEPQAFGDGDPAYGAKFPVVPGSDHHKLIVETMRAVAKDQWKEDGEKVLKMLIEDGRVCFIEKEYKNKKTGEPYQGFEKMHYLGGRNAKVQPSVFDRFAKPITDKRDIERIIYSGCNTNISIDIWAQDNKWGRRINATLRGVMFASDGARFGGAPPPASDSEFADLAAPVDEALDGLV